jgi:parallel beta-helix repeat protein
MISRDLRMRRGRRTIVLVSLILFSFASGTFGVLSLDVSALTPHGEIVIDGDSDFIPANGVTGGSGTYSDPYIIDGWSIEASGATGINISYANVCFEIRNMYIYGGGPSHFGISMFYAACGGINNVSVINNQVGVYLYRSNLVAYGSNITHNLREGILGFESSVRVENTNLTYNGGCGLFSSFTDYIGIVADSNVTSNGGCGIAITDSNKGFIDNNNVSLNAHQGIVADIYDNDGTISGNVVFGNGGEGLLLFSGSGYLRIENNTISHNNIGMTIEGRHNHISNNLLVDNHIGIEAWWGSDNVYANNVIVNPGVNIHFDGAPSATLSNNEMSGLGIQMEGYYLDEWNTHQIDASNTVQGKPVFYLSDAVGGAVPTGYAQVILGNCTGMTIESHEIENVYTGVNLGFSSSNVIKNNNLTGNHEGIKLDGESRDNVIQGNSFERNMYGVWIDYYSESNTIYHNNFIDSGGRDGSGLNSWDNGYPSGGNYWSVYSGVDDCSGPNQDICPDPDGIGDTPHFLSGNAEDNYPLMIPRGISFNPPFSIEAVSSGRFMGDVDIRSTRSHDEGEIYTVKRLETLRSQFIDIQNLILQPEPLRTDEIQKLEISTTQNKFQCLNVLSAKRN